MQDPSVVLLVGGVGAKVIRRHKLFCWVDDSCAAWFTCGAESDVLAEEWITPAHARKTRGSPPRLRRGAGDTWYHVTALRDRI